MDTATISVSHQQYAIVSDGVVSLYEGDGTAMTTPSRGYLTVIPSTEYRVRAGRGQHRCRDA
jgi:hypothetical protein